MALWSLDTRGNRITNGFKIHRSESDELVASLVGQEKQYYLGEDSANNYHVFELRGMAGSKKYDFYINGNVMSSGIHLHEFQATQEIGSFLEFGVEQNSFSSDVYFSEVSLSKL